jgi:hypothetical protein
MGQLALAAPAPLHLHGNGRQPADGGGDGTGLEVGRVESQLTGVEWSGVEWSAGPATTSSPPCCVPSTCTTCWLAVRVCVPTTPSAPGAVTVRVTTSPAHLSLNLRYQLCLNYVVLALLNTKFLLYI